ncbi:MAG TPA: 4-hydroxy-tetrahydrodipicolinate reductase [Bacteroidia bacterium]|nr:4-hydroxy-tetrahydrodipicolinate reductase [Bacteroidia bacterium]
MKIVLVGHGKMGKAIETLATKRGHTIRFIVNEENAATITPQDLKQGDVAIEFSQPTAAAENILRCFEAGIPVVSGTTGWNDRLEEVKEICRKNNHSLFYSSNFSIGVNVFFEINKKLASLMNHLEQYDELFVHESHHIHKLDSPSGTAITLAEQIIANLDRIKSWRNYKGDENISSGDDDNSELPIFSSREDEVPGTHIVKYFSDDDELEIIHKALNRQGFAFGAVAAAEWLQGKKGVFGMQDLLKF